MQFVAALGEADQLVLGAVLPRFATFERPVRHEDAQVLAPTRR